MCRKGVPGIRQYVRAIGGTIMVDQASESNAKRQSTAKRFRVFVGVLGLLARSWLAAPSSPRIGARPARARRPLPSTALSVSLCWSPPSSRPSSGLCDPRTGRGVCAAGTNVRASFKCLDRPSALPGLPRCQRSWMCRSVRAVHVGARAVPNDQSSGHKPDCQNCAYPLIGADRVRFLARHSHHVPSEC